MRIAIVDSGIHPNHPHVGAVAGAVAITMVSGRPAVGGDAIDRLGHGTAVAGAIREKAPHAHLFAVKVFDSKLSANISVILRALLWCRENAMDIVNLSLGTANEAHRERFIEVLGNDLLVVSAAHFLPGSLPEVIGVAPDPDCPRDRFRYHDGIFYSSPYPRPIPGVPIEANLQGVSFAVANMTGLIASSPLSGSRQDIRGNLISLAENRLAPG